MAIVVLLPVLVVVVVLTTLGVLKCPKVVLTLLAIGALLLLPAWFYARVSVPQVASQSVTVTSRPPPSRVQVPASLEDQQQWSQQQHRLTVQGQTSSGSSASIRIDFPSTAPAELKTDKPWVKDWTGFVNSSKSTQHWIRAGTTELWGSEEKAREQARTQAAMLLLPEISRQLRVSLNTVPGSNMVTTDQWVLDQINASIFHDGFVKDEFINRIERPYGDVWSCELLIDGSPQTIRKAVQDYRVDAKRQVERTASTWVALAALVLLIVMTYAFLNWVTKGYFVWRLRAAAVGIVVLAVVALMALA